jgi:hypothetical protein
VELPVAAPLTVPPQGVTEELCEKDSKGVGEAVPFIDLEVVIVTLSPKDGVPITGLPELQPEVVGGALPLALKKDFEGNPEALSRGVKE